MIDEASRNLLEVAVQRLFSNLRRHYPAVDLEVITALEVEDNQTLRSAVLSQMPSTPTPTVSSVLPLGRLPLRRMMKTTRMVAPMILLEVLLQLRMTQNLS